MDAALKEIMKEERRRRKHKERSRSEPRKSSHKHHDKERRREKERERRGRSRSPSPSVIINIKEDGIEKFMFVYEDKNGTIYPTLDAIEKSDGDEIKIFPVYVTGYNDNLSEETIVWKDGNFTSSVENSWLNIIQSDEHKILQYETEDIIVYNGKFFHCLNDLYEYIETYGAEYLPIKK